MIHVRSCCFAYLNLVFSDVLAAVASLNLKVPFGEAARHVNRKLGLLICLDSTRFVFLKCLYSYRHDFSELISAKEWKIVHFRLPPVAQHAFA